MSRGPISLSTSVAIEAAEPDRRLALIAGGSELPDLVTANPGEEVGQWKGGGIQTGDAFDDIPVGSLPAGTGKKMEFTGMTVLRVENGLITEEIGLDDGVMALKMLGLIPQE